MTSLSDLLERVREHWTAQGLGTGSPVADEVLAAHELRHGVTFPADLHAYFCSLNGMARHVEFDKEWDKDLIRFFPLEEFGSALETSSRERSNVSLQLTSARSSEVIAVSTYRDASAFQQVGRMLSRPLAA